MKIGIRPVIFGIALLICLSCWAYMLGTLALVGRPSVGRWTAIVTVTAFATEACIWVGAFTVGWTMFANRRRLWHRLTGRKAP